MLDDIIEMILKEARTRDRDNLFASTHDVIVEVFEKVTWIIVDHMLEERRMKEDENKGCHVK